MNGLDEDAVEEMRKKKNHIKNGGLISNDKCVTEPVTNIIVK